MSLMIKMESKSLEDSRQKTNQEECRIEKVIKKFV